MKAGMGKRKGSEFERKVCKDLSCWVSKGTRDDIFWRSACSGGRATVNIKKGGENASQLGDISMVDSAGATLIDNFVIECKNYADLKLSSFIYGTPKSEGVLKFWGDLSDICNGAQKLPMLVCKENGKPALIAVSNGLVVALHNAGLTLPAYVLYTKYNLCLFNLDEFLTVDVDTFQGLFNE